MIPEEMLIGFTRALRAAGVGVTQDRAQTYLDAVATVGLDQRSTTYWAGRATLCSGPDDLGVYERVFDGWFGDEWSRAGSRPATPTVTVVSAALDDDGDGEGGDESSPLAVAASATEILRHRDIASLSATEKAQLQQLFGGVRPRAPRRPAYRHAPHHRGPVDARRTVRQAMRNLGEPLTIAHHRRAVRPRKVVLLIDVSGSMSSYADALLRLAHRFSRTVPGTEVFTVGTRVTRVTRALRQRDPERALVAAGEAVPDWSGGTRLGETLRVFLDRWGQRGIARGAVVVVFSDGWERGGSELLGEQMHRLHRLSHRVVWANPHKGLESYQPLQQGIVAALPYVDDFVAGHSMAAFTELTEVVARA